MAQARIAEATRWFRQATYDLKAARWNREGGFHETACFLSQQAGEKALKSLLYYLGARRVALLTHSLVEMVEEGARGEPSLRDLLEDARSLDLHYIPSRYPNGLPAGYPHQFYAAGTADRAIASADKILAAITGHYGARNESAILSDDSERSGPS